MIADQLQNNNITNFKIRDPFINVYKLKLSSDIQVICRILQDLFSNGSQETIKLIKIYFKALLS